MRGSKPSNLELSIKQDVYKRQLAGMSGGQGLLVGVSPEEERKYLEAAPKVPQNDAVRAIKILCGALDKMRCV